MINIAVIIIFCALAIIAIVMGVREDRKKNKCGIYTSCNAKIKRFIPELQPI